MEVQFTQIATNLNDGRGAQTWSFPVQYFHLGAFAGFLYGLIAMLDRTHVDDGNV